MLYKETNVGIFMIFNFKETTGQFLSYFRPPNAVTWSLIFNQSFNFSFLYSERNPKTIKYCGDKIPYSLYSHEGVIKIRVVGGPNTDGGVFQFEALARKRDFGTDCL